MVTLGFVTLLAVASSAPDDPVDEGAGAVTEQRLEDLLDTGAETPTPGSHRYSEEDLRPYFGDGPLAEAKRAFDHGQFRLALRLFVGDALPVRYLRALSALGLHRDVEAAQELTALANDYAAMRDRCLFFAGRALEHSGHPKAAQASYAAVGTGSAVYPEARFALAEVLTRNGHPDEGIAALQPLRDLPAVPRNEPIRRLVLLHIIQIARGQNDYPSEYQAMVELWATSPRSAEAPVVWERLKQQPLPNTWRLKRAEALLSFNDNLEAMRLALQVKTTPPDREACRAGFVVGNALRKERHHRRAVRALLPVVTGCPLPELRPRAMFVMGYSQSVVDMPGAIKTYEQLARDYPKHPLADDALLLAAELYARTNQVPLALERLEQVVQHHPAANVVAAALFKGAWLQWARGATGEALAALEQLEALPGADPTQTLRARYWHARLLEPQDAAEAQALLTSLAREEPGTWYGILARSRLPKPPSPAEAECGNKACGAVRPQSVEAGPLASNPRFLAGVELLRMGLKEARDELLQVDRRTLPEEPAWLLMQVLDLAGQTKGAALVASLALAPHLRGGVSERTRPIWEATYPLAFRPLVEKSARRARLDPDLLQALMREESRFNRYARSSTGAIGLTQLMPETARRVASRLRLAAPTEEQLMLPALNLRLGGAYLGSLITKLGSVPFAVAAYNAGPPAVQRWTEASPASEIDKWVEEIPFEETRNYVMRVLASYGAYQLVYRGAPAVPLARSSAP